MNFQKQISENIRARGYYEGYKPVPLMARHVAKLAEELGELGDEFYMGACGTLLEDFESNLRHTKIYAKLVFDNSDWQSSSFLIDPNEKETVSKIKKELADCLVVIMSMAQIVSDNFGEFDVLQAALDKSERDIERGVR